MQCNPFCLMTSLVSDLAGVCGRLMAAAALPGNLANGRDGRTGGRTDAMTMIRSNTDQPHLLRWKWIIAPFWTESGGRTRTAAGGRGMLSSPCIPLCENRKIFFRG